MIDRRLLSLGMLVAACSSSNSTPAPGSGVGNDGGASDATTADDSGVPVIPAADGGVTPVDDAALSANCGPAPYINLGLTVKGLPLGGGSGNPVPGVTLTSPLCPGVARVSGADGLIQAQVAKGTPFYARLAAPNFITTLIAETNFAADTPDLSITIYPSILAGLVPGFGADKTVIGVGITAEPDAGTCAALDGITVAVTGHPEAVVTYLTNDSVPKASTGTVTTEAGRAIITGIAVGDLVTVTGTKAGCTVVFDHAPYTGRVALEVGALSLVPGVLR